MKYDPAHIATDEEIAKIEKLIAKEYKKAHKEVSKKLDDYLATFANKDEKWQEWVANGTKTQKEYETWKKGQILVGKRWEDLRDQLAEDYTNAAAISQSIAKGYAPEVYALNHNYGTFQVEKGALADTSYSLYSREAVERMYRENPKLYPTYGKAVAKEIKLGKQHAWDKRRIQSVLMQGIVQGESIPKLTKRLEHVTGGDHKAAIRNARTMMTGVQNAGRIDAYERAKNLGIPVRKQWLATLDARTRHWHRQLDGEIVDSDEPFKNEFGEIMFPGDPTADAANVYNCRCTLLAAIKGFELNTADPSVRPNDKLGEMTYDEWKATKKSISNPITLPEQKAANIQGAWWGKYGGGAGKTHKHTAAEGKKLMDDFDAGELAKAKAKLDKLGNKEYADIWQGKVVKVSDYADMETPIKVKHYYLDNAIKKAESKGDTNAVAKYKAQKKSLEKFEKDGKKFLAESGQDAAKATTKAAKASTVDKTAKAAEKAKKAASTATKPKPTATPEPKAKPMTQAQAKKALKEAEEAMDDVKDAIWYDIWKEPVTPADYAAKKNSIAAKRKYFEEKYQEAFDNHWSSKVVKFENLLEDLDEFEKLGKQYEAAKLKADAAKKALKPFEDAKQAKQAAKAKEWKAKMDAVGNEKFDLSFASYYGKGLDEVKTVADYELFSKEVKNAKKMFDWQANWYGNPASPKYNPAKVAEAKKNFKILEDFEAKGKEWKKLNKNYLKYSPEPAQSASVTGNAYSAERKAKALWPKTQTEYLRADKEYEKLAKKVHAKKSAAEHEGYYHYTWGSGPFNSPLAGFENGFNTWGHGFKGPGKVDLDVGGYGSKIRNLTSLVEKSKYDFDFWVQSGQSQATLEGMLGLPYGKLAGMTDRELQQFVGKQTEVAQFISGAINKGGGSYTPGDMVFNIYCPQGSEALYVRTDGHFKKHEHEMILQRGGTYKITRIYWGRDTVHGGQKLMVDLELRLEKGYNKFQQRR